MANNNDNKVLNVPNLRFPEFTGEWKQTKFKDVCKVETGNKNTQDKVEDGLYPFYVRSQIVERINAWNFDGEAILTAGDGVGVGKVFHYSIGKIGVHQRVYILSGFKCDGKYLYNYFSSRFYNRVKRLSAKNSVDSVRMEMITEMPLSLPSLEEQNKIGRLLSLLEDRIATQNKIIDRLQSLIKGLNDYIQNSIYGEVVCFSELGEPYSGLSGKIGDDFGTGKPFITYMNVYQNTYVSDKEVGLVKISANEKQNHVRYGDALFTLSSETPEEVGMGAVYLGNEEELYLNSFCFGVHINDSYHVHPQYLAYLISSTNFRKSVYPLAQGSTRFNLQKNDFMRMRFTIPELSIQKRIAETLDNISNRLAIEQQLQHLYIQQKQHLLCQMFI